MSANLQMTFLLLVASDDSGSSPEDTNSIEDVTTVCTSDNYRTASDHSTASETNEITKKPKVYHIPSANTTLPPIPIYFKLESNDSNGLSMSYTVENCNCNAQYDILSVTIDDMDVTSVCNKDSFEATSGTDVSGAVSIGYGNATPNSTVTFTGTWTNTDTGTTEYFDFHYSFHISEIIKE
ncbi:hypothetical protein [Ruminococcus sp.]|uniref:hypothetical protein n=1 Tax=Ruminococcus sp. TaxID=41978 RepID=UPI0039A01FCD